MLNDNDNEFVMQSLEKLVNVCEGNDYNNNNNNNEFITKYFCNKECYDKFISVINKIKHNNINLNNIDWTQFQNTSNGGDNNNNNNNSNNIIANLIIYYYNLGLSQNKSQ
jgi:phosphopantetheinyl transferase (holo-ACP synthase)